MRIVKQLTIRKIRGVIKHVGGLVPHESFLLQGDNMPWVSPKFHERQKAREDSAREVDLEWQARSARAADNRERRRLGLKPKTTPVKV